MIRNLFTNNLRIFQKVDWAQEHHEGKRARASYVARLSWLELLSGELSMHYSEVGEMLVIEAVNVKKNLAKLVKTLPSACKA